MKSNSKEDNVVQDTTVKELKETLSKYSDEDKVSFKVYGIVHWPTVEITVNGDPIMRCSFPW